MGTLQITDLPIFPTFRRFTTNDFYWYQDFYTAFQPYADISPVNLMVWLNIDGTLEVSRLDTAIVFRYINPFAKKEQNYILLEPQISYEHVRQIYDLKVDSGFSPYAITMKEQPAPLWNNLEHDARLHIEPSRDSYEYILDTTEQSTLPGKKFSRQRRRVGFFERSHIGETITVDYLEEISEDKKNLMIELLAEWKLTAKDMELANDNREHDALTYAIQAADSFNRRALIVTINGRPISFSLFTIYGDTALIGHIKVDYQVQYAFDYTTYRLAAELAVRGVRFMNFEQDLGIPGLRDHKMRLRPVRLLEKCDITLEN